jgi:negative regulator of flagellin synthesis FlgM
MRIGERQFIAAEKSDKAEIKREEKRLDAKKAGSSGDSVTLSSKAREAADIALALKETSDVRKGLVEELKTKIENGTYSVSGKEIVQKFLNSGSIV